jgi:hypothetical protein
MALNSKILFLNQALIMVSILIVSVISLVTTWVLLFQQDTMGWKQSGINLKKL